MLDKTLKLTITFPVMGWNYAHGYGCDEQHQKQPVSAYSKEHKQLIEEDARIIPAWVMPLMRAMKAESGHLGAAWEKLPNYLPCGVGVPPVTEAAEILVNLGIAGR